MADPVEYRTPLPGGRNLRHLESADGIRISRDAVSQTALWRESIAPTVVIAFLLLAIYFLWWQYRHWHAYPPEVAIVRFVLTAAALLIFLRIIRGLRQNAGVVTEIAVTRDTFYWRKETLWGSHEYFWPLASVRGATVDKLNRMLKVHRHRGAPLGAFSFHSMQELELAAAKLNEMIERNRNLH